MAIGKVVDLWYNASIYGLHECRDGMVGETVKSTSVVRELDGLYVTGDIGNLIWTVALAILNIRVILHSKMKSRK